MTKKKILVTAALPYVNNAPHLGNIIGCVLSADVYTRFMKNQRYKCVYICGTDEYGTATEMEAKKLGINPIDLCTKNFKIHKSVYKWFDIKFDYFGRTSCKSHIKHVQKVFIENYNNNNFIKKNNIQFYCEKCEMFLADRFVRGECKKCHYQDINGDQCDGCGSLTTPEELINPYCTICKQIPIKKSSDHLYLNLKKFTSQLNEMNKEGFSDIAQKITKDWLKKELLSRAITRDLKWGVKVPNEGLKDLENFTNKIFYVWFDAPIGYITFTKKYLRNTNPWKDSKKWEIVQFMGKDNVSFHTIIFPSILFGTDKYNNVVSKLSSTEYLNFENDKFSKSRGVGIFGSDLLNDKYGECSVWRYYLIKNRPETKDTNFGFDSFKNTKNNISNDFGNLVSRTIKFLNKNSIKDQKLRYKKDINDECFIKEIDQLLKSFRDKMLKIELRDSVRIFEEICSASNKKLQLTFDDKSITKDQKINVFCLIYSVIKNLVKVIDPLMPKKSKQLQKMIGKVRNKKIKGFKIYKKIKILKTDNLFDKSLDEINQLIVDLSFRKKNK